MNANFVNVKINKDQNAALAGEYGVQGIPATLFLDEKGAKVSEIGGYLPPPAFLDALKKVQTNVKQIAEFEARLAKDPNDLEALMGAGKIHQDQQAADKAEACFKKVLDADKENAKGFAADAHYHLGYGELMKNNVAGAKPHFDETKKLDPENKRGFADDIRFIEIKVGLQEKQGQGKLADGLAELDEFAKNFPASEYMAETIFYKGMILWQTGKRQEGLDVLKGLAASHPNTQFADAAKNQYIPAMEKELQGGGGGGDEHGGGK